MGFRGAWNKRNKLIEDLDTFLKLYKKAQKAYNKVRKVEFSNNDELIENAKKKYQEIWDEFRAFVNKKAWVDPKLWATIRKMNQTGDRKVVKTYSRDSQVISEFVNHTIAVHNGKTFVPIYITPEMVGHKLGEFAPTRTFRSHPDKSAKVVKKK